MIAVNLVMDWKKSRESFMTHIVRFVRELVSMCVIPQNFMLL